MTRVSQVKTCDMSECGFNREQRCHAAAIQVGDSAPTLDPDPRCDTFTPISGAKALYGAPDWNAGIGACKVSVCIHNADLSCTVDAVSVGHHGSHADCQTYQPHRLAL